MKRYYYPAAFVFLLLVIGCGKTYRLDRFPKIPAPEWQYTRGDLQSSGQIESNYRGGLNPKWRGKFGDSPVGPLTFGAGNVIVPSSREKAYFFDPVTGKNRGRVKTKGNAQTGLMIVDSLAYFSGGYDENYFKCLNLHTLGTSWKVSIKDVTGAPIILEDRVYLASTTGKVECRNRLTGDIIWQTQASSRSPAGPSVFGNRVYFPLDNGVLTAFDTETGEMIFESDLEEPLMAKVAVGGMVFVTGAEGSFWAVDKETGETIWRRQFDWPIWTAPAVDENMVYFGDNGGFLRALDKKTGRTVWEFQSDGIILASPIVVGNYLLFASLDRYLYSLEKKSGLLNSKWKSDHEIRFSPISDGESIYVATFGGVIQCLGD